MRETGGPSRSLPPDCAFALAAILLTVWVARGAVKYGRHRVPRLSMATDTTGSLAAPQAACHMWALLLPIVEGGGHSTDLPIESEEAWNRFVAIADLNSDGRDEVLMRAYDARRGRGT